MSETGREPIRCKFCGKFVGVGARQGRSHDWQGVPVEDYLVCPECDGAVMKAWPVGDGRYCSHHDDDPAHGDGCYINEAAQ